MGFDVSCFVALILLIVSEILNFVEYLRVFSGGRAMNYKEWIKLDPGFIKEHFTSTVSLTNMMNFASLMNAVSLFALLVPILQVSWILSDGGKKHLNAHVFICVFAAAGGLCELVVNLMMIGVGSTTSFLVRRFNLDDWDESDAGGTGWRVLEVVDLMMNGMMMWVNALEWICMFFIMAIIFSTVRYEDKDRGTVAFGKKWSILGLVIGILGLFEFISDLLRISSWVTFMQFSFVIRIINMWIFVPAWLFVLGSQLSSVKASFEDWKRQESELELAEQTNPLNPETGVLS